MATTFQIIDKTTNKAISLNDFDAIYCNEVGEELKPRQYGEWFNMTEIILNIYGDIADYCEKSSLRREIVSESRKIPFHTAAQCLLIWQAKMWYASEVFLDIQNSYISRYAKFLHNHQEYYFEFSF